MFRKLPLPVNRNNGLILYKILHDILFVMLTFFLLAMIAEGMIYGIITTHIGFAAIIISIFLDIIAIYALGIYLGIDIKSHKRHKKTALFLLLLSILLIFNSLLKINIILNLFLVLTAVITGYFAYKVVIDE